MSDHKILGFTGTRNEPTDEQLKWLRATFVVGLPSELHHGACIGADAQAHWQALNCLGGRIQIVVHPPDNQSRMMPMNKILSPFGGIAVLSPKPYLDRNRDIVDACDKLIALPDGPERPKSGTWYTVRYAMKMSKPVWICYPDGTLEDRLPNPTQ